MPEYRRPKTTGGTYFFTVATYCRRFTKNGIYPKDWGGDAAADKGDFDYGE